MRRECQARLDGIWNGSGDVPPQPPAWGMVVVSATWHGVVDLVKQVTLMARSHRDPPTPEALASIAAQIRDTAAEKVGPMPFEVRAFLAEFGEGGPITGETATHGSSSHPR